MELRTCVHCGELTRPGLLCSSCGHLTYPRAFRSLSLLVVGLALAAGLGLWVSRPRTTVPASQVASVNDGQTPAILVGAATATSTTKPALEVAPSPTNTPSPSPTDRPPTVTAEPTRTATAVPPTATMIMPTAIPTLAPELVDVTRNRSDGVIIFAHKYAEGSPGKWRINALEPASDARQTLAGSATGSDVNPVWSPDGQTIAFATETGGNRDIWLMDADGSSARRLTQARVKQQYAAWSPDSSALIFTYTQSKTTAGLYRMLIDGSQGVDLGEGGNASWSVDNTIIFALGEAYSHDVWRMDQHGNNRTNITRTPDINEEFAVWSPDGRQIAFVANKVTSNSADDLSARQIWIMNVDGRNPRQLTFGRAPSTNPAWSADGQSLVFVSRQNSQDWQVWTMRADGSEQTQRTFDAGRKFYVSWGP